jgi:hypothetical protein
MRQRRPSFIFALFATTAFLPAGCRSAHSPTVDVLGSYFPAWIICILAGVILTIIARQFLIGFKLDRHVRPAPLIYLCLAVCFTLATWLIFFKN